MYCVRMRIGSGSDGGVWTRLQAWLSICHNSTCHKNVEVSRGVAKFFSGERPGLLKAITRPPCRGSGGEGPRTVAKFHFLKRFKVLENESIFHKYQLFLPEKFSFSKKNFEKMNIFYKNFWMLSISYFRIFNFDTL